MKISDLIGETTEYDKKVALEEKRPKSWLKSVSAFANCIGGVLIFGVSDNDELFGLSTPFRKQCWRFAMKTEKILFC